MLAIANAHLDPGHLASLDAAVSAIRRDLGTGGGVSQPRRQAMGPPAERRVQERRLPCRPVRDFDRAGRASRTWCAKRTIGGAATQSGVALPRDPRWQVHLRGGRWRPGLLRLSGRRRPPEEGRATIEILGAILDEAVQAELGARTGQAHESPAGRVAVVTGAGRGIGAATARALADAGLDVGARRAYVASRSSGRPPSWARKAAGRRRWSAM